MFQFIYKKTFHFHVQKCGFIIKEREEKANTTVQLFTSYPYGYGIFKFHPVHLIKSVLGFLTVCLISTFKCNLARIMYRQLTSETRITKPDEISQRLNIKSTCPKISLLSF